jgi:DivIVA domain-containing protein
MPAVDIDRQAIERRDFPITRRGYDPAAVDAHLRALANEIEDFKRERQDAGAEASLASTAGTQVHTIIAAAEAAAADIERQALASARTAREDADREAARTREQAIAQARAHIAAVAQAAAVLLERVGAMDAEVGALIDSLRTGAGSLAGDLAAVEKNMGELYDAASGRASSAPDPQALSAKPPAPLPPIPPPEQPPEPPADPAASAPPRPRKAAAIPPLPAPSAPPGERTARAPSPPPPSRPPAATAPDAEATEGEDGDLDGARLIALNMALNGESRADAERYLAENFRLVDRQKLIDEVYAAIEG